jgi:hypothetical protein
VAAFVRSLGLRPRVDPTNRDRRRLRNALRLDGVPALERVLGREIIGPIAETAAQLQVDEDFIRSTYVGLARDHRVLFDDHDRLPVSLLREHHRALASRMVQQLLVRHVGTPEKSHVDAILDLAHGRPGRRVDLPGGFTAIREREYIRLSSPETEIPSDQGGLRCPPERS